MPMMQTLPYSPSRGTWCGVGGLLLVLFLVWLFWPSCASTYGSALSRAVAGDALKPQSLPAHSSHHTAQAAQAAQVAQAAQAVHAAVEQPRPDHARAEQPQARPTVPRPVQAPMISSVLQGAAPLDESFQPSAETSEYYKYFQPQSLESAMPAGWRAAENPNKCAGDGEDVYSEFSRYAISPNQMKRAENMRSVLRLSESSRDGLSRTLGQRSLLRDFVTPIGASPIGNSAFVFSDSSVRQNYIASATGKFPEVANC